MKNTSIKEIAIANSTVRHTAILPCHTSVNITYSFKFINTHMMNACVDFGKY